MGFAGSIVDHSFPGREYSGHNRILGTGDTRLSLQEIACAMERLSVDGEHPLAHRKINPGAQGL